MDGIGFLLQRAHARFREGIVEALAGSDLNPGQLAIVGALFAENDRTQRDLTIATGIEKSSMVIMLDRLEGDGWLERRVHPSDRRAHVVHLTSKGKARLRSVGPRLDAVESRLAASLADAEKRQLIRLLKRLI